MQLNKINELMNLKGRIYRVIMKIAHRYNWHYAPPIYPEGDTLLWCKWCGLRYVEARNSRPIASPGGPCTDPCIAAGADDISGPWKGAGFSPKVKFQHAVDMFLRIAELDKIDLDWHIFALINCMKEVK